MKDPTLLHPQLLWLAIPVLLLLAVSALLLSNLAAWRRAAALFLQGLSVILLLLALAQPAFVQPNKNLSVVVVLDASSSLSQQSRQQAVDYAKGALAAGAASDDVRFIAVGQKAVLLTPQEVASGQWAMQDNAAGGDGTDLAAGLRLAGSLLGDSGARRIVLVSDGWETTTQGQAANEAAQLATRGIDLQAVGVAALGSPEVIVERLDMPQYVRVGDDVSSSLQIYSTDPATVTLKISVDGAAPVNRQVKLEAGENQVPLDQKASAEGFHWMQVSAEAANDTSNRNNSATATLVVKPQPKILVLEDRAGESAPLVQALSGQQMTVEVRSPSTLPPSASQLVGYDSIVLDNVAATSMSLDQQRTVQEYVQRDGGGLVVVGGKTSFAKGAYADSLFEDILPVSSQPPPRPQQGTTAMVLVIDRSFSMDEYRSQNLDEPSKFSMAKQAAQLAVDALSNGDSLGVISFDTSNMWSLPLQIINSDADKEAAKNLIRAIPLGGGTAINPALQEAADAIRTVNATNKHIVLLTDGMEFGSPDYRPLLDQLRADSVSLSTIGVGSDADTNLLTLLAQQGQGRYYFTEQPENIPRIVFKDLNLALKQAMVEGNVQPRMVAASPVLRGFSPQDLPLLGGYDMTTPKSDATTGLVTDIGDPLLANWNYGLGRVVAFTSDVGPDWAARWLSWSDFARFWDQAVRWSMPSPINKELQPTVSAQGGLHISVESLNPDNSFSDLQNIMAGVRAPSGAVTTTLLSQTAPGRYEATSPLQGAGAYEVRVQRQGDRPTSETAGFSAPPDPEYQHAGTNDALLKAINGGKEYLTGPRQALDPTNLQAVSVDYQPLWPYPLMAGLVLLLLSVAVRRIDFRPALRRRRNKTAPR